MSITQPTNLILNLSSLHARMLRRVDGSLSVHGISFTEFLVMMHLSEAPNMLMRRIDLAECIGLTASGVTRLLSPMEKIGLVNKEANSRDARVSLVKLTNTGKQIFKDAELTVNQVSATILTPLTDSQKSKFIELTVALL